MSIAQKGVINRTDLLEAEPDRNESFKILLHIWLDAYLKWASAGILLIMCFDGTNPAQKKKTLEKRTNTKKALQDKITELESKISETDLLEVSEADLESLKNAKSNLTWVSKEEISKFKNILISLGIPCLTATGQGEKLCVSLVIDNVCTAALGKDSDMLAYGCKSIVRDLKSHGTNLAGETTYTVEEIDLSLILKLLNLEFKTFVDFCIGIQCDYNTRIKNYGPAKMYNLLSTHKNLENIGLNIECLDVQFCRNEFKYSQYKNITESGTIELQNPTTEGYNLLCNYGLSDYYNKIARVANELKLNSITEGINIVGKPKIIFKKRT
jgi:5'-3' exonuclease